MLVAVVVTEAKGYRSGSTRRNDCRRLAGREREVW
jgi:hypothetical protein